MHSCKSRRLLLGLLATCMLLLVQCDAILTNNRKGICESDLCKCSSGREITVTCSCLGAIQQQLELTGIYTLHQNTQVFRAENCQQVIVPPNTFKELQNLRRIHLSNIGEIIVRENSFIWKLPESTIEDYPLHPPEGITIQIEKSSIPNIPAFAFRGRIKSLLMNRVHVETVAAYALTSLYDMESIEFVDSNFTNLQGQAFKKFFVETITFKGGNYGTIPSRAMVDVETRTLLLENISADLVHSSAFIVIGPESFKIRRCKFTLVEGDAFRIATRGPTVIQDNTFISLEGGAFAGITVENSVYAVNKQQKALFSNNNVTHFKTGALVFNTSRLVVTIDRITIEQPCSCKAIELWSVQLTVHPRTSLQQKLSDDKTNVGADLMLCRRDETAKLIRYITFHEFTRSNCGASKSNVYTLLIIIVASSAVLLIIGVVVILVCRRKRLRQQLWTHVPVTEEGKSGKTKQRPPDTRITMVVPDGRVYRETELHVISEQLEPIADDRHIYQNLPVTQPKPRASLAKPTPLPRTKLPEGLLLTSL